MEGAVTMLNIFGNIYVQYIQAKQGHNKSNFLHKTLIC